MSVTDDICELLASYNGRDKVVRLACYSCKLYGCLRNQKPWQTAGSKLSSARMMLRLFDDIPTIRDSWSYGLGRHETSKAAALLGVSGNIIDQIYLPVEKACWLYEVGILKISEKTADKLDIFSTILWAAGLCISLLQTIRSIRQLYWGRDCLRNSTESKDSGAQRKINTRLVLESITAAKLCLDITHAVSCFPSGWLWGERIGATKVAGIATTSSVIGLALYFAKRRMLK